MRGIVINGKHSWYDYHALFAGVEYDYPERQRVVETVPFSNVEYDFSALFGSPVYQKRDVKYKFKFASGRTGENYIDLDRFITFLYGLGDNLAIYDDNTPGYYWKGRVDSVKDVSCTGREYGARMVEVTFRCDPKRRYEPVYSVDETRYPDVDGDGHVNSIDASLITEAAVNIGSGRPSGLTEEQEIRADADRNGDISAVDASLVSIYSTEVGTGTRSDTVEDWTKFLGEISTVEVV